MAYSYASNASTSWRRGNEAPMQWEYQHASTSTLPQPPTQPSTTLTGTDADASLQDVSMPDVSMAPVDDADEGVAPAQSIRALSKDDDVEEIPRPPTESHGNADHGQDARGTPASTALTSTSSRASKGGGRRRRRRRSSSAASSSSSVARDVASSGSPSVVAQWPIAPVVGTVVNYLVPPISKEDTTSYPHKTSQQSVGPAQKAKATLHPRETPLLLLSYAQLAFNASLLFLAMYVVFALVWTIRADVLERLKEIEDAYHHSISTCQRSFQLNCLSIPLAPALHAPCQEWERCAGRKLTEVLGGSRLRVVIEVLSEAWEAGVAGLGWRTLAFSLLVLSLFVGGANSTLNSWRLGVMKSSRRRKRASGRRGSSDDDDEVEAEERDTRTESSRNRLPYYPPSPLVHPQYQQQQHYLQSSDHHAAPAYMDPSMAAAYERMFAAQQQQHQHSQHPRQHRVGTAAGHPSVASASGAAGSNAATGRGWFGRAFGSGAKGKKGAASTKLMGSSKSRLHDDDGGGMDRAGQDGWEDEE